MEKLIKQKDLDSSDGKLDHIIKLLEEIKSRMKVSDETKLRDLFDT